jgi:hypothetical protein
MPRLLVIPALFIPLFTEVRGIRFLRTSPFWNSANFAFWVFLEVAPALVILHTGHVDQRKAGPPKGPALS